jgi:hypothetical protein
MKKRRMTAMPTLDRIAKTIVGPNEVHSLGIEKLAVLQDLKWGRLKAQEQAHFLRAARFVQALFDFEPDGWVITSGDDAKVRTLGEFGSTNWTQDLDEALWFARRDDAERFCEDDEDAWHIRRVSEVRRMWASQSPQGIAQGAAQSAGRGPRAITTARREPPPQPVMPPCDQRSTQHLLFLFRSFVIRNATQWIMGAGDHHHPIWQDLAEELEQHDLNHTPSSGPDYQYIQPMNRKPHAVLLEEFAAKGGDVADSQ